MTFHAAIPTRSQFLQMYVEQSSTPLHFYMRALTYGPYSVRSRGVILFMLCSQAWLFTPLFFRSHTHTRMKMNSCNMWQKQKDPASRSYPGSRPIFLACNNGDRPATGVLYISANTAGSKAFYGMFAGKRREIWCSQGHMNRNSRSFRATDDQSCCFHGKSVIRRPRQRLA